jgi:Peptidase family M28
MKKLIATAIVALLLLPTLGIAQGTAEYVDEAFEKISPDQILWDAEVLTGHRQYAGELIESRDVEHPDHELAMDFLTGRMEEVGLLFDSQPFDCLAGSCANLAAEIPGSTNPETIWLVGAHFDSTNGERPLDPAEGAVDNASGTIIVLQVLEALAAYEFEETIRFVLFDAEEIGLRGSYRYVEKVIEDGDSIELMINLDVPGWRAGNMNFAFANSDQFSWPYLQTMNAIPENYDCGTGLIGVPAESIDSSDMRPFWEEGFAGLMVGSLYSLTGWMNTDQDTLDKLDLEQCANVAKIVAAYLIEEAGVLGYAPEPVDDDDDADPGDTPDDDDDTEVTPDPTSAESDDDDGCGC